MKVFTIKSNRCPSWKAEMIFYGKKANVTKFYEFALRFSGIKQTMSYQVKAGKNAQQLVEMTAKEWAAKMWDKF